MPPLAGKVLATVACVTALAVLIALMLFGAREAKAALAAGFIAFIPALAQARVEARIPMMASPKAVFLTHLLAWAIKLIASLVLLVLLFVYLQKELSVPYFLATYVVCLMSYGVALLFK